MCYRGYLQVTLSEVGHVSGQVLEDHRVFILDCSHFCILNLVFHSFDSQPNSMFLGCCICNLFNYIKLFALVQVFLDKPSEVDLIELQVLIDFLIDLRYVAPI